MKVILNQDIKKLGKKGDVVEVAKGYARNYLLPKNLGIKATPKNILLAEKMQEKRQASIEENIELTVWLDQGNPELLENDWAHLQNETRAGNATLELGPGSDDSEEFEVDDCKIHFKVN